MKLNLYRKQFAGEAPTRMKRSSIFIPLGLVLMCLVLAPAGLQAQIEMTCDGTAQTVAATGALEDLIIPMDTSIAQMEFTVHGADGGFADLANGCVSAGGAGATATAQFDLGDGEGEIPYGSTIRFVVGIAGEKGTGGTVLGTGNTYGGGGGGTGILYKAPDSDEWQVLMVAGGGGGAYQGSVIGICVDSKTGEGGRSVTSGGDGNGANGGQGGMVGSGGMAGGLDGLEMSGGGGGAYTIGEGITCVNLEGSTEVGEGQQGFPLGGAGGGNEGCFGATSRDGGFGFGGGAAGQGGGGGGGGFSGGGGGGSAGRGGGGGSYILNIANNPIIEEGGLSSSTEDGFAQYRCIKNTEPTDEDPVAACIDSTVVVSLNAEGLAVLSPVMVNGDTLNPALDYSLSAVDFNCDSLGERSVTLLVQDEGGRADSCTATIRIVDDLAPEVECPASAEVSCDTNYSVEALGTATAIDNCGDGALDLAEVVEFGDCAADLTITRTWTATDVSGNSSTCTQVVVVTDSTAPTCANCPEDITVSCDEVPDLPELEVDDNCDEAPVVALEVTTTQTESGCSAFSYTETRTWTITDACGNATEHVQVITVVDEVAPECANCPEDMTVSCDAVPEVPELEVSDNCDPDPSVTLDITSTQTDDGSCSQFSYVETRTWTITDACGNATEHVQVITVEDTDAPEITCPPTVTVTCDNDPSEAGFPDVLDNCDPAASFDFEDVVLSGDCDWDCMIERTWTATDACGNSSTCTQMIQQSVLELIEDALSEDLDGDALADPLVIGRLNRHSLTVTLEGAACMLGWMPNNGGTAWPLVREDFVVDGTACTPDGLPIGEDGKMTNPLISETLIMGIKLRLDPSVGEVLLADLDCDIHPIVFQGLPRDPTVADLYKQANLVVGNIIGLPFTAYFADALACINGTYGLCPDDDDATAFGGAGNYPALKLDAGGQHAAEMRVFPNPVRSQLSVDLSAFAGQNGQLRIFNAVGQNVYEQALNEISADPMSIRTNDLSNGLYLLQVRIGDRVLNEQIVVQGK
ncbi:T9SS type A sorting domain-containing protein [Flavilitoribacter nigricans]|nr:T9SS type A sorting domain-containing protein [Flavilitoribacter nigricans]